jgi:methylmalonyl-CoA mutase
MPDRLTLRDDFPPVPTAEWDAAIGRDLTWTTGEGISAAPYYRQGDVAAAASLPVEPWETAQDAAIPAGAIRADELLDAGATAVQQLAYMLSQVAGRTHIDVVFAVRSAYFIEIAKLRAARRLLLETGATFRIHVRTARIDKSAGDPYLNLLRATTEAMSAAIGGCDRLTVEPSGFSPRLAGNVQHILRHEAHLDEVADPGAGSYYIEALTDSLIREARRAE